MVYSDLTWDLEIQDRINSSMMTPTTDFANKKKDSRQSENRSRERDIVRKGMERLEKEISQYTQVQVSKEQVDIALLQRCKTTDIPAVNLAITNIQKALEKYVGFNNIDSQYCDKVGEVMDKAQNWCLEIEQEYNKAEVYSINTSKGDTEDVGTFSDNSETTVFEFLEAAELAYLGWGNSVQKANRLYNRHLSEEIKSRLINISDHYELMKQWLIKNYGGPSRIVGDIIGNLIRKPKPEIGNRKEKFVFYSAITGAMQRLERLSRVSYRERTELESCLLSRSTLSSMIGLLPISEYELWVREMTMSGLDFKNPVGMETFNCFKRICVIERNTCESARTDSYQSSNRRRIK